MLTLQKLNSVETLYFHWSFLTIPETEAAKWQIDDRCSITLAEDRRSVPWWNSRLWFGYQCFDSAVIAMVEIVGNSVTRRSRRVSRQGTSWSDIVALCFQTKSYTSLRFALRFRASIDPHARRNIHVLVYSSRYFPPRNLITWRNILYLATVVIRIYF